MKIRLRLTLWYFSVTFLLLIIFSLGIYFSMQHLLYRTLDRDLRIVAYSVSQSYDPEKDNFDVLAIDTERVNPYLEYFLIVYDELGNPLYRSPIARQLKLGIPLTAHDDQLGKVVEIKLHKPVRWLHRDHKSDITFRGINSKIYYQGEHVGWVTVALPIGQTRDSMRHLLNIILICVGMALVFISASGYLLTRKALLPVQIITTKARQISETNLNQRIEGITTRDELGALADTLNDLLQRLQRAFESQRDFMEDAAHELKTPLSVLRAHWESELNNPALSIEMKEKLARDIETITRLTHLLNNLLLLSQTEDVRSNFVFEQLALDEVLESIVADARMLAEMKEQNLYLENILPVKIHGDRTRIYQLFFNIIDNAIKYTQPGGEIRISAREEDSQVVVEIRDNGPGIPRQHLPRIFDRFYRIQKDRARQTGGSGLGLAICKLIAESHHGTIEVESEEGKGTVFRIRLPLIEDQT